MAQDNVTPQDRSSDGYRSPMNEAGDLLFKGLEALASLKFTVGLFAASIALILFGTLAQTELSIWGVLEQYFRCWVAKVEFKIFFPPSFFDGEPPKPPGWVWFPGGKSIGVCLFLNLLAAHSVRFKVQTGGARLWAGIGVIALGTVATWLVIVSGSNPNGMQSEAAIEWTLLWEVLKYGLGIAWVAMASSLLRIDSKRKFERATIMVLTLLLGAGLVYVFYQGDDARLNDSSMRILWQLCKAQFASLILLGGCILVFRKRAGIVLLHAGIGLLMFNELLVATKHREAQMQIVEGQTVNYVEDSLRPELAIVDHSDEDVDKVVVISAKRLMRAYENNAVIDYEKLPFRLKVIGYLKNSTLENGEDKTANRGFSSRVTVEERETGTGTDTNSKFDQASAYVEFIDRESEESLGVYLVSQHIGREQSVVAGGRNFGLTLRPERIYKPYSMRLIDARGDTYLGTDTARNYSSELELVDESRDVKRTVTVWMNNPLRYAGETFYQSNFGRIQGTDKDFTVLQVVTNTGWMIPYVACMIVLTGMLAQFWISLLRFLNRRASSTAGLKTAPASAALPGSGKPAAEPVFEEPALAAAKPWWHADGLAGVLFPAVICGLVGLLIVILGWFSTRATRSDEMDLRGFGELPVVYRGRVKPVDSLSRNTLRVISNKQTFKDQDNKRQTATRWMLQAVTDPETSRKYRVYRVMNLEVIATLGRTRRKGFRYSLNELMSGEREPKFREQVGRARNVESKHRTVYQRGILKLYSDMSAASAIQHANRVPSGDVKDSGAELLDTIVHYRHRMERVPLMCPMPNSKQRWQALTVPAAQLWVKRFAKARNLKTLGEVFAELLRHIDEPTISLHIKEQIFRKHVASVTMQLRQRGREVDTDRIEALTRDFVRGLNGKPYFDEALTIVRDKLRETMAGTNLEDPDPPQVVMLVDIFAAYKEGDVKAFNEGVIRYKEWLAENAPEGDRPSEEYSGSKMRFESVFNRFEPYFLSKFIYLFAFVLAALAWLGWAKPLNRAAFGLVSIAFAIQTTALIGRMYISGRWGVTVTNLYSSALFIGWGCCLLGMILERVSRIGIGNAVASLAGCLTLWVADGLSNDGDTIAVMQAVLDTNFWLATHVTTITLGYSTTYLAALLGCAYIFLGVVTPKLTQEDERTLSRMTYGCLCFAIFFSFVGTVLGGLWADDSWGRFWGWDPKENGALIIVLWNSLVLHARWGGMVKHRGMAVLSVVGAIVTTWSWFGVNLLGVGLHAYGFNSSLAMTLFTVISVLTVVIALGLIPKDAWWSCRRWRENAA